MYAIITASGFPSRLMPNSSYNYVYSVSDYWEPINGWNDPTSTGPLWKNATFNVPIETIVYTTGTDSDEKTYYCVLEH